MKALTAFTTEIGQTDGEITQTDTTSHILLNHMTVYVAGALHFPVASSPDPKKTLWKARQISLMYHHEV